MQAPNVQLYPGSSDSANVKKLQDYLVGLGLMTQAEVNTGYGTYGPKTTAAVSKLQQQLGVDTSAGGVGNYGPMTSAAALKTSQNNYNGNGGLVLPSNGTLPGLTPINNSQQSQPQTNNPFNPSNVNISMPNMSVANSTPSGVPQQQPGFSDLVKNYYSVNNDTLSGPTYNPNSSVLNVYPTVAKPADISGSTSYPLAGNPNDPVQSNSIPTPAYGNSNMNPAMIADAINTSQGNPTNFATPDSRGALSQLIADRAMGRGLYALEKGVQYSPEQINARRNAADAFYANHLNEMIQKESQSAAGTTALSGQNTKASPYIQALLTNPDVSKSPSYVKQLAAQLSLQTPDQQIETVKRVVMQTLPTSQQNQFTSNDQVAGQINGALSYLPTDITNNPYKYQTQRFITYLGGTKDPKYNDFKSIIGNITAPYLNNLYGAVLSSGELARANQFVPDLEVDDTATIYQKLRNLQATTRFANDKLLARYTGAPEPNFADYLSGKVDQQQSSTSTTANNTGGINPLWNSY